MAVAHLTKKNTTDFGYKTSWVKIDEIHISEERRKCKRKFAKSLAKDIEVDGLRTPISVYRDDNDRFVLVAGLHRLEAFKILGRKEIPAFVIPEKGADGWAITENWLRHQDDYLKQCCELARLAKLRVGIFSEGGKQPADKGISKIAKALGMTRSSISRMLGVACLDDTVLMLVREHNLQQRKTLLHKASRLETGAAQIQMLQRYVTKKNSFLTNPSQVAVSDLPERKRQYQLIDGSKSETFRASRSKIEQTNDRSEKLIMAWKSSKVARLYKKQGPNTQAKFISKIFKREVIDSALNAFRNT